MTNGRIGIAVWFLTLLLSFTCWNLAYAQETVSGTVTDAQSGKTLPAVNILVKGTTTGTSTDSEGQYQLNVPSLQDTLVFSFVGYKTRQVPINGRTTINISLETQAISGEEMVVVGYGTQKRKNLTISQSSVKGEEVQNVPVSSFDQALQGKVAGLQVRQTSSRPGGDVSIRIRGNNSINSGGAPLFVVDGLPLASNSGDNYGSSRLGTGGAAPNILSTLNPDNVESVSVLKGPSATAIYGSRGANGVIIINTKKGNVGQNNVNVSLYTGVQQVSHQFDLLNAEQYSHLVYDARTNADLATSPDLPEGEGLPTDYNTNWQDQILRTAPIQKYNLSVSGGDQQNRYNFSAGYFNQKGIVDNSDLERVNLRINGSHTILDRIEIGENIAFSNNQNSVINTGKVIGGAYTAAPNLPVLNENGFYTHNSIADFYNTEGAYNSLDGAMPKYYTDLTTGDRRLDKLYGTAYAQVRIFKNLEYKLQVGGDFNQSKQKFFVPENGLIRKGRAYGELANRRNRTLNINNRLQYETELGKHSLKVLALQSAETYNTEYLGLSVERVSNITKYWGNPDKSGGEFQSDEFGKGKYSATSDWSLLSYLGRVNYGYNDTYLLTASIRADGSSKFGTNNKWGYFPSVSAAWILSQESFLNKVKWLSNLKLRGGYGESGNSNISPYTSLSLLGETSTVINGELALGQAPSSIPDPNLSWETTKEYTAALDASFLNNRVQTTIEYYKKNTIGLLLDSPLPYFTGFGSIALTNIGRLDNHGMEFSLNTTNFASQSNGFQWNTAINVSFNRSELKRLASGDQELNRGPTISRIGEPIGRFYGYEVTGIFQDQQEVDNSAQPNAAPGDRKYLDWNGVDENGEDTFQPDGNITDADKKVLGNPNPDVVFGINNTFNYKNFALNIFINGSYGNDVYNKTRQSLLSLNGKNNNLTDVLNRWPYDKQSGIPRAAEVRGSSHGGLNSAYIEDGSYIRLTKVQLGYSVRPSVLDNLSLSKLNIFAGARNLLLISGYSGMNPNVNGGGNIVYGIDSNTYPRTRTIYFGINLGF